jgi:hypothetical protein
VVAFAFGFVLAASSILYVIGSALGPLALLIALVVLTLGLFAALCTKLDIQNKYKQ